MNITKDVLHALQRDLYPPPNWLFASEVQVPYVGGKRFLDAVAVNVHRRPYETVGVEAKVSRADLLVELRHPEKMAPGRGAVDRFYYVFGSPDIYKMEEVPVGVGVIDIIDGRAVETRHAAYPRDADAVTKYDRGFMAAFLSRCQEYREEAPGFVDRVRVEAEAKGYRKGLNAARRQSPYTTVGKRKHSDHARANLARDVIEDEDGFFCD